LRRFVNGPFMGKTGKKKFSAAEQAEKERGKAFHL